MMEIWPKWGSYDGIKVEPEVAVGLFLMTSAREARTAALTHELTKADWVALFQASRKKTVAQMGRGSTAGLSCTPSSLTRLRHGPTGFHHGKTTIRL